MNAWQGCSGVLRGSRRLALTLTLTLALAGSALGKKPPPAPKGPDCTACQPFPLVCKEIKRCVKSCNVTARVAYDCFKQKRISEEAYTEATGRAPDDFDAIVDESKLAEAPEAKPGTSLPEQLTMEQIKAGMAKVDFTPCIKEGNVKPGEQASVMVKVVIEKDGRISDASCPQNSALSRCVVPRIKAATFPRFGGMPMKMTYPVLVRAPQP